MLAEKIKYLRKETGLTQLQLGKKVGVDQKQICRYEAGETEPSISTLQKMAEIFKVTVDFLIDSSNGQSLDKWGFKDKELFVYCQTIDKMSEETRKAAKLFLKIMALNANNKKLFDMKK